MSDTGLNIDPNIVIQDLLQQVNKLTADNTVLRSALQQIQNNAAHTHEDMADQDKSDVPDQTK